MIKKIERPDFDERIYSDATDYANITAQAYVSKWEFDKWFDQHIEPLNKLIDELVEALKHYQDSIDEMHDNSSGYYGCDCKNDLEEELARGPAGSTYINCIKNISVKHQGGIEPIKKETAEDVLKIFIEEFKGVNQGQAEGDIPDKNLREIYDRAKRVLDE